MDTVSAWNQGIKFIKAIQDRIKADPDFIVDADSVNALSGVISALNMSCFPRKHTDINRLKSRVKYIYKEMSGLLGISQEEAYQEYVVIQKLLQLKHLTLQDFSSSDTFFHGTGTLPADKKSHPLIAAFLLSINIDTYRLQGNLDKTVVDHLAHVFRKLSGATRSWHHSEDTSVHYDALSSLITHEEVNPMGVIMLTDFAYLYELSEDLLEVFRDEPDNFRRAVSALVQLQFRESNGKDPVRVDLEEMVKIVKSPNSQHLSPSLISLMVNSGETVEEDENDYRIEDYRDHASLDTWNY